MSECECYYNNRTLFMSFFYICVVLIELEAWPSYPVHFTLNVPDNIFLLRHRYDVELLLRQDRPVRVLTHPSLPTRYAEQFQQQWIWYVSLGKA